MTFRAPILRNCLTTCRQASTNRSGLLSKLVKAQGNHVPFISCARRTMTGLPKALAARAHSRM